MLLRHAVIVVMSYRIVRLKLVAVVMPAPKSALATPTTIMIEYRSDYQIPVRHVQIRSQIATNHQQHTHDSQFDVSKHDYRDDGYR